MNHNQLEPFLQAVLRLARESCGSEFEDLVNEQRRSREKFLKSLWADQFSDSPDVDLVFREIDFDTTVNLAVDHLDQKAFVRFLLDLGNLGLRYGQLDKSREVLKRIITEYSDYISPQFLGTVHQLLGDTALYQSDLETALNYYKQAQEIQLANGNDLRYAYALNAEGIIHAEQGNTQASLVCFKEAYNLAQEAEDKGLIVQTSMNLANLSHTLGNYHESLLHLYSTQMLVEKDDVDMLARVNHNLGVAHKAAHHVEKSLSHFNMAINFAEQADNYYSRSLSLLEKAEVLTENGDVKEGSALLTSAFQSFSEIGDRLGMADAYKVFGEIACQRDSDNLAQAFFNNSLSISSELDNLLGVGETHTVIGKCYREHGNEKRAQESFQSAIHCFEQMKAPSRISEINTLLNDK